MATLYQFFDRTHQRKPRDRRRMDWQLQLISALSAVCLLLAMALIYRSHQALAALVHEPTVAQAPAGDTAPAQQPAPAYNAEYDVWQWLEPLPPTF